MFKNIPVKNPKPDAKEFIDILLGKKKGRVPLVEYLINDPVRKPIMTDLLHKPWVDYLFDRDSQKAYLDNFIEFWYRMGYDVVRFEVGLPFPVHHLESGDVGTPSSGTRTWIDEHKGAISSWEDFEKYPWPVVNAFNFFPFEYINDNMPEGMGLLTCHAGGIFEHLSTILSLEGLSFALYENPELVKAIADKLGQIMTEFYKYLLDLDRVIAIFPGDDMGYRSGTLISPEHLKEYCLPWHKRFAQMAHDKGLPYFLHSCGNLTSIMDHLIDNVKIDGKHSYEDVIIPVQDFHAHYGDRIAVLGGMDINILSSGTPEEIRAHTRFLVETCGKKGRYAVGSGNSIPTYIPVISYLSMLDEALNAQ
jgi:uroporphyrinogen decarboxylase